MAEKTGASHNGLSLILSVDIAVSVFYVFFIIWLRLGGTKFSGGTQTVRALLAMAITALVLRLSIMAAMALRRWWSVPCMFARAPLWACSVMIAAIINEEVYYFTPVFFILVCWDLTALIIFFSSKRIRGEFPASPPGSFARLVKPQHDASGAPGYPGAQVPYAGFIQGAQSSSYLGRMPRQSDGPLVDVSRSACPHCGTENPSGASHCSLCLARLEVAQETSPVLGGVPGQAYEPTSNPRPQAEQSAVRAPVRPRLSLKSGDLGKWGTRCAIAALVLILVATILLPIAMKILSDIITHRPGGFTNQYWVYQLRSRLTGLAFTAGFASFPFAITGLVLAPRNPDTGKRRKKSLAFIVGIVFTVLGSIIILLVIIAMIALSQAPGW